MSMPTFPPCGADLTKDEALTMIIASIAMEELALSHILNAEGEKLQYVLGTLPGGGKPCGDRREILEVNRSVKALLDTVLQSQMLLKGKLEAALEAGSPPPRPEPAPCEPEETPGISLSSCCRDGVWENGALLFWRLRELTGSGLSWDEKCPALIHLDTGRTYLLTYTLNVRTSCPGEGAVQVKTCPCDAFGEIVPLRFTLRDRSVQTLQQTAVLFSRDCGPASLSLVLRYPGSLCVEAASLSIVGL